MPISGGFTETNNGWLGSETRVKILGKDFLADDDLTTVGGPFTDELNFTGAIQVGSTSQELYAYVNIPTGYKATEIRINCAGTIQVRVWVCDINGSSGTEISNTGVTQYTNAVLALTETASTDSNYLLIFAYTQNTTAELIYGGYMTIEKL